LRENSGPSIGRWMHHIYIAPTLAAEYPFPIKSYARKPIVLFTL